MKTVSFALFIALATVSLWVSAQAPIIKSDSPVIYLVDNLDEKGQLGWCIDTEGRGFAETLQAHSCKPAGKAPHDTQFLFDEQSAQIRSVAFEGKCMTLSDASNATHPFALLDCDMTNQSQKFLYDPISLEIRIHSDQSSCVGVSQSSIIAGPFMSRDLIVGNCATIGSAFKQWVIQ